MYIEDNFDEKLFEKISTNLKLVNYNVTESDKGTLEFLFFKQLQTLKNFLNSDGVPDALLYNLIDRVVGEFLQMKVSSNSLNIEGLELGPLVSQITIGDTSTSFKGNSQQETFAILIQHLLNSGNKELYHFRKVKW